jgi:nucleoside phosphorylase
LLLDHEHEGLDAVPGDPNNYILGEIGGHNVVLAYPGAGEKGESAATYVASNMVRTFEKIRIGLLVGIAGGAPKPPDPKDPFADIRLGDVVVSSPVDGSGGVRQVDYGKRLTLDEFKLTDHLNKPPNLLLTGVQTLRSDHAFKKGKIREYIRKSAETADFLKLKGHSFPGWDKDQLFRASYSHLNKLGEPGQQPEPEPTCSECDTSQTERRLGRDTDYPAVHYGLIASGNQVVRSAEYRDRLREKYDILCFEMEAAGLMDNFPCLVVRGICDYSDNHKNKLWQPYAATVAAAYAKDLLRVVRPHRVREEKLVVEIVAARK